MNDRVYTVLVNDPLPSGHVKTQGTEVLLPTGERMPGVLALDMSFEPNGIVTATLKVHCRFGRRSEAEQFATVLQEGKP